MPDTAKWIIVSNRLPFQPDPATGGLLRSSGGLVTAVSGIHFERDAVWLGSFPQEMSAEAWEGAIAPYTAEQRTVRYVPVYIDPSLYDAYYNGVGNDVLWPLLHYETQHTRFDPTAWESYREVNRLFADAILDVAGPDDLVWIHDFHLFLLPAMLREARPGLRIGFFLHVPFPSSEVFRQLPVRREVLESLLQSDLVGFHDYDYLRHFCAALRAILGIESNLLTVRRKGDAPHTTTLGVFPVAIDTPAFAKKAASPEVKQIMRSLRRGRGYEKLVLGVDRLDYTKGIDLKLESFRAMLRMAPELRDKVRLLQIAVPSRTEVPEYQKLRRDIERLVGAINGEFGKPNVVPVHYMFSGVPFEQLLALYRLADVLLVTSKRDGMNLVALEYVAAQKPSDPGVVVLSEFAGSISFLTHVVPINPWDFHGTAQRLHMALSFSRRDRVARHGPMLTGLQRYTSTKWAESFMRGLEERGSQATLSAATPPPDPQRLAEEIGGRPLRILLDYDGTLLPLRPTPRDAVLSAEGRDVLELLAKTPGIRIVIVSGREARSLQQQLGGLDVSIAAEHGARFLERGSRRWRTLVHSSPEVWYDNALRIIEDFAARTPGSFVERKRFGVAWHYRGAPREFASHQARKLAMELEAGLTNLPATVVSGEKVIEARAIEANKGAFFRWMTEHGRLLYDNPAVLVLSDDRTDEDLFVAATDHATTIKVGSGATSAHYRIDAQRGVVPFLHELARRLRARRSA